VPVSPNSRTGSSVAATRSARRSKSRITSDATTSTMALSCAGDPFHDATLKKGNLHARGDRQCGNGQYGQYGYDG